MSVEAAASLFGSDDTSSDPFASLGSDDSNTSTHREVNAPSTQSVEVVGENTPSQGRQHYNYQVQAQESRTSGQYDYNSSSTNYHDPNIGGAENALQGWYDEAGNWCSHERHNGINSTTASAIEVPATSTTNYNSYNPQSVQSLPAQSSTQQPYSPYDPYNPATQTASNTYAPIAEMQSLYDPYKPSLSANTPSVYGSSYSYSPATPSYSAPPSNVASIPPVNPPPPKAPLNRPKVSNAYDPPFPVSNKRAPSTRLPSTPGYSAYSSYAPPATAPAPAPAPPPPPAPRRSPPPSGIYSSSYSQGPSISKTLARTSQPQASTNISSSYGHRATPSEVYLPNTSGVHASYRGGTTVSHLPGAVVHQNGTAATMSDDSQNYDSQNSHFPLNTNWTSQSIPLQQSDASDSQWLPNDDLPTSQYLPDMSNSGLNAQHLPQTAIAAPLSVAEPCYVAKFDEAVRKTPPSAWSRSHHPSSSNGGRFSPGASGSARSLSPASTSSSYQPMSNISPSVSNMSYTNGARSLSPPSLGEPRADPYGESLRGTGNYATSPDVRLLPASVSPDITAGSNHKPPPLPLQTVDPYAPSPKTQRVNDRSASIDSGLNSKSDPASNLYAPRRQLSESFGSLHEYQAPGPGPGPAQVLLVPPHLRSQYAPSPSLLGSNDPLGRTAVRVPVFSFGFGGKMVTCFHDDPDLNTGFDVALSSRKSTAVQVRVLNKLVPESAVDTSLTSFPGPLFLDPGTPHSMSLVRTGMSAQIKAKKTRVTNYLSERADELLRAIGYLHAGTPASRQAEGKLVLVNLLKVMIEHDGRLSGTPQIDRAVRVALVRQIGNSISTQESGTSLASGFAAPVDLGPNSGLGVPFANVGFSTQTPDQEPISVTTLRPSALDKIQDFLIRGERQRAYHFALDEKLWAHGMVIASSIGKEAWQEVVGEFLKSELGVKFDPAQAFALGAEPSVKTNGREGLRVAYSLYSGQAAAAVQELIPQSLLARASGSASIPLTPLPMATPTSTSFASMATAKIPEASLALWAETAAMIYSSPLSNETSLALTSLGDHLLANNWVEAAHVCYLLSPQTSPMGGTTNPGARLLLVSGASPRDGPNFFRDPDTIIFTEIVEFALSLATPAKGQEPFAGLPYMQPFRLLRAVFLAEMGHVQQANRYIEAISASRTRPSPYFTTTFEEQLKGLSDRITAVPQLDKLGSWIGGKMAKPSMDSIGNWLEGRFTKLITGDGDGSPTQSEEENKDADKTFSGPFAHYSSISPSPSPGPTMTVNTNGTRRTGSAMALSSPANSYVQIDRASSVTDYHRRRQSPQPLPRVYSAAPNITKFDQSSSFSQAANGYNPVNNYSSNTTTSRSPSETNGSPAKSVSDAPWWGSTYIEESNTQTPTASTYLKTENSSASSSSGFISLMDDTAYSVTDTPTPPSRHQSNDLEEYEEDLGFGNSKPKPKKFDEVDESKADDSSTKNEPTPKKEEKPPSTPSSGWFGRFWKRDATPAPIKASLGEESAFYFDEKQKRWVNKNAPPEPPKSAAPPPPPSRAPSRAQTASPSRATGSMSPSAPPARPSSAADLTNAPPMKASMRIRSNLVPSESAPPTPMSPGMPPNRPSSQASRRNIRSRYVDVFQQESGSN